MHVRMLSDPVCFPYEFTLLSNGCMGADRKEKFVSPTNLHCSQTKVWFFNGLIKFVSPTNLHCSQTTRGKRFFTRVFVSPTNLHCSQTPAQRIGVPVSLFPLRIYTALKQGLKRSISANCLFPLRIYTALKHTSVITSLIKCLFPLRIYTALKHYPTKLKLRSGLFPLRIYTALKRGLHPTDTVSVCFPYEFTLLSNSLTETLLTIWFVSPTNLHCSQTSNLKLPEKNICEIFV